MTDIIRPLFYVWRYSLCFPFKGCFSGRVVWRIYSPFEWSGRECHRKNALVSKSTPFNNALKCRSDCEEKKKKHANRTGAVRRFQFSVVQNDIVTLWKPGSLKSSSGSLWHWPMFYLTFSLVLFESQSSTVCARPISAHPPSLTDSLRLNKHTRRVPACLECCAARPHGAQKSGRCDTEFKLRFGQFILRRLRFIFISFKDIVMNHIHLRIKTFHS